jgi:hypothetical protein
MTSILARFESCGFLSVGSPKTVVYTTPVTNEEALHHRIVMPLRLRNYPDISEQMRCSMMRRVEACIESHGRHFEHILYMYSFSHNSQI